MATTSSFVLLGDTLFDNYIITFNKIDNKVGFYGNTAVISIFGNNQSFMTGQWVMLGINIGLLLFAVFLLFFIKINRRS